MFTIRGGLMSKQSRDCAYDCRVSVIDLHLIDRLATRVRQQLDADEITPSIIVQALHHKGLDLAETRAFERDTLSAFEQAKVIRFEVTNEDSARLERHLKRIQAQRQHASTQLPQVQRAVIRLGLVEASTRASFPAFCEAVRLLLPQRDPEARPAPAL
jgi:transcription termination factor NusB